MAYDTKYTGPVKISLADQDVGFGSCEIADDYGEVQSASITREADAAEFRKCNNDLLAVVMTNHRFQFTFEVLWSEDKPLPGLHERVAFPGANTQGRIQNVTRRWSQNGAQLASITATSWDAMLGSEYARTGEFSIGVGESAVAFDGYTFTNLENGTLDALVTDLEVSYSDDPGILINHDTETDSHDNYAGFHEPSSPIVRMLNFNNAILFKNGTGSCVYDPETERLHVWKSEVTAPADSSHADYAGYVAWKRTT